MDRSLLASVVNHSERKPRFAFGVSSTNELASTPTPEVTAAEVAPAATVATPLTSADRSRPSV